MYNNIMEFFNSLCKSSEQDILNIFNDISNFIYAISINKLKLEYNTSYMCVVLLEKTYGNDWFILKTFSETHYLYNLNLSLCHGISEFFNYILPRLNSEYFKYDTIVPYAEIVFKKLIPFKNIFESKSIEELKLNLILNGF